MSTSTVISLKEDYGFTDFLEYLKSIQENPNLIYELGINHRSYYEHLKSKSNQTFQEFLRILGDEKTKGLQYVQLYVKNKDSLIPLLGEWIQNMITALQSDLNRNIQKPFEEETLESVLNPDEDLSNRFRSILHGHLTLPSGDKKPLPLEEEEKIRDKQILKFYKQYVSMIHPKIKKLFLSSTHDEQIRFAQIVKCLIKAEEVGSSLETIRAWMKETHAAFVSKHIEINPRGGAPTKHKYKGKSYKVRTGKRGGKYITVNDKKIYI